MQYTLTKHAKERMEERSINLRAIESALANPTEIKYNANKTCLIKKLYRKDNSLKLLLIAGERQNNRLKIFTVIETSKIKKYL